MEKHVNLTTISYAPEIPPASYSIPTACARLEIYRNINIMSFACYHHSSIILCDHTPCHPNLEITICYRQNDQCLSNGLCATSGESYSGGCPDLTYNAFISQDSANQECSPNSAIPIISSFSLAAMKAAIIQCHIGTGVRSGDFYCSSDGSQECCNDPGNGLGMPPPPIAPSTFIYVTTLPVPLPQKTASLRVKSLKLEEFLDDHQGYAGVRSEGHNWVPYAVRGCLTGLVLGVFGYLLAWKYIPWIVASTVRTWQSRKLQQDIPLETLNDSNGGDHHGDPGSVGHNTNDYHEGQHRPRDRTTVSHLVQTGPAEAIYAVNDSPVNEDGKVPLECKNANPGVATLYGPLDSPDPPAAGASGLEDQRGQDQVSVPSMKTNAFSFEEDVLGENHLSVRRNTMATMGDNRDSEQIAQLPSPASSITTNIFPTEVDLQGGNHLPVNQNPSAIIENNEGSGQMGQLPSPLPSIESCDLGRIRGWLTAPGHSPRNSQGEPALRDEAGMATLHYVTSILVGESASSEPIESATESSVGDPPSMTSDTTSSLISVPFS